MVSRRQLLTGLLATGMVPRVTWADVGNPAFLSAARDQSGAYALYGLSHTGARLFRVDLPSRGHSGAAHPFRPEAVAFARRPGTFAMVLNCAAGTVTAQIEAPAGRHFYGHGAFSLDGSRLYTTENDYDAARGRVGIWDAQNGYVRIGEVSSGGVGPHEMLRLPGQDVFAVANGGIETHPEMGRQMLNIPFMRPNLSYLSADGDLLGQVELPEDFRKNSIRHLAAASDGQIAFAMQWHGSNETHPPLLGLHRLGQQAPLLISAPEDRQRQMQGYAGSVAMNANGSLVAVSSPRGGVLHLFSAAEAAFERAEFLEDICGLGPSGLGVFSTSGTGHVARVEAGALSPLRHHPVNWDNHLTALPQS